MAKSRVRESDAEIAHQIKVAITQQERVRLRAEVDKTADEVQEAAKSFAPVRTGKYRDGIKVKKRRDVDGLPRAAVVATTWYSHLIEFGTGADTKQGSPFGPDTPTPTFAPMEKAANAFGGTLDGVTVDIGEDA